MSLLNQNSTLLIIGITAVIAIFSVITVTTARPTLPAPQGSPEIGATGDPLTESAETETKTGPLTINDIVTVNGQLDVSQTLDINKLIATKASFDQVCLGGECESFWPRFGPPIIETVTVKWVSSYLGTCSKPGNNAPGVTTHYIYDGGNISDYTRTDRNGCPGEPMTINATVVVPEIPVNSVITKISDLTNKLGCNSCATSYYPCPFPININRISSDKWHRYAYATNITVTPLGPGTQSFKITATCRCPENQWATNKLAILIHEATIEYELL